MIALVAVVFLSMVCGYMGDNHLTGSHLYNNPVSSYHTGSHLYNSPVSSTHAGSHLYNSPVSSYHAGSPLYNSPIRSYHAGGHLYDSPLNALHSGSLFGYPNFDSLYANAMFGQQFEPFNGWGRFPQHNFAYPNFAHTSDSYGWVQPSLLDSILTAGTNGHQPHFGPMLGHQFPHMGNHFPFGNHLENHLENHLPLSNLQNLLGKFEDSVVTTDEIAP